MRLLNYLFALVILFSMLNAHAGDCTRTSSVCIDTTPSKEVSGFTVTLAMIGGCWEYQDQYVCASTDMPINDCQPLIDKGCGQISSKCLETLDTGACSLYENKYQCVVQEGATHTVKDCGTQTFCSGGSCFDTQYQNDGDITQVISGMEAMREAAVYFDGANAKVFNGNVGKCTKKLGGIFNCCSKKVQKGVTNNEWMPNVVMSVGSEAIRWVGSNYMYDILFAADAPDLMFMAAENIIPLDASLDFAPSVWGVTMGYSSLGAPANALASWGAGSGKMFISFDPYSFAAAVAMQMIMQWAQCDEDEQILSVKRGANLCNNVGSYCSDKVFGVCIEKTESYCCYNSKIARIINTNGRSQLGMGYGSAKHPDCSGFTVEQLQMLDFSEMNFSEMTADINAHLRNVGASFASDRATSKVPAASSSSVQPYTSQGYFAP